MSLRSLISRFVVPAKSGTQVWWPTGLAWIPEFANMTDLDSRFIELPHIFKGCLRDHRPLGKSKQVSGSMCFERGIE